MTILLLREMVDLATTLSFSETANRMHLSPSTLSKHISALEVELGVQLFERTRQYVKVTPRGVEFCTKIKEVLRLYDNASYELRNPADEVAGTLRIGFLDAAVHDLLKNCIKSFKKDYPGINLLLSVGELGDIERELQQTNIDMCISIRFQNSPMGMNFEKLYDDCIAAVIPTDNPLANRQEVRLFELLDYPIAFPSHHQYPALARLLYSLIDEYGRPANIVSEFSHINEALLMAESSAAISLLPAHICQYPHSASFVPLSDPETALQVGCFWPGSRPATGLTAFIKALRLTASTMDLPPR